MDLEPKNNAEKRRRLLGRRRYATPRVALWLTHRAVRERQGDTKDPRMTARSTINDGLHNPVGSFHGPHPEKTDRKKRAPSSTTPHRPDSSAYFMLIYWVRGWELLLVNDAGQRNQTACSVHHLKY